LTYKPLYKAPRPGTKLLVFHPSNPKTHLRDATGALTLVILSDTAHKVWGLFFSDEAVTPVPLNLRHTWSSQDEPSNSQQQQYADDGGEWEPVVNFCGQLEGFREWFDLL
jgi:hypothetical protein